jgi:simple sugar transport system permease protein
MSKFFKPLAKLKRKRIFGFIIALVAIVIFLCGLELAGFKTRDIINTGLFAMTPLAFAAVGECMSEKAGVINIGLEGILLISCVIGVYGAELLGSGIAGLLIGSLAGGLIGFIFGIISVYGRAGQIVAGMGINIFGMGFLAYLLMAIWGAPGIHIFPQELKVGTVDTPLGYLSPLIFVAIIAGILAHIFLHKTLVGLRIRAAGEKPEAVDVAGVSVKRTRIFMVTLGGALCGLGGAFLAIGWFGGIVKEISAGRGFIALACVVFAGLEPLLALAGAFIFGFAEALGFWAMTMPAVKAIPFLPYFLRMLPYVVVLVVVAIFIGKRMFPSAIGKPYLRE